VTIKEPGTKGNPIYVERRFIQLSNNEKRELQDANKCYRCKKEGHIAQFCPENQNRGRGQPPNRFGRGYGGCNNSMRAQAVDVQSHIAEFLENAMAEDLNEMSMALKEAQPVEQDQDF
jgi:hypothetical protein